MYVCMYVCVCRCTVYVHIKVQISLPTSSDQALFMMSSLMMSKEPCILSSRLKLLPLSLEPDPSVNPLIASVYARYSERKKMEKECHKMKVRNL